MKITAWKGGRSDRIEARITPKLKTLLLARVRREGYKTFADWLEAQAEKQDTQTNTNSKVQIKPQ